VLSADRKGKKGDAEGRKIQSFEGEWLHSPLDFRKRKKKGRGVTPAIKMNEGKRGFET